MTEAPVELPIARRLFHSAGAATLSQVWRLGVTFATHMALRRLIPPEQFGVWNWAEPLFIILAQVRDLGVPGQIVRSERRPYGNYLALQAGWGGLLTLGVVFGAPVLALLYADRGAADVVLILQALCVFLFVQGLGSVPMVFFEAELEVGKTVPAELARNAVFAGLSLWLAWTGHGVWSLVIAHVAGGVVYAAMLWWKAWGRIDLGWAGGATRPLVLASLPLALMAALEQLVLKLDTFVLGLRFPTAIVGFAGLALYAVFFFARHLADPVGRALYPALVRYKSDPPKAFKAFRICTLLMVTLVTPTAFFLLVNARLVARFLGGEEWVGAATYLQVLSLVPLVRPLSIFGLEFLLTRHRDRLLIVYGALNLLTLGGLGLYLTTTPLEEIGMAVAAYFPLGLVVLAWGIYRIDPSGFRRLHLDLLALYAVGGVLFLPILLLHPEPWGIRFALSCLAGLGLLAYVAWRHGSEMVEFLRDGALESEM